MTGNPPPPTFSRYTETLHTLCGLAAEQTLAHFRSPLNIANKTGDGFDPVTIADQAAERAIRRHLQDEFPDHGIFGEEEEPVNPDAEYCWIIDPIDGTRAFISGLPTWGTLIGLNHGGRPIVGVMHQPFTGEKYFSDGKRAFLEHSGHTTVLSTSKVKNISDATVMSTAPELFQGRHKSAFDALTSACRLTRFGFDCYAYAMVAAGHVELVAEPGLNPYDIAPLIPIIEAAGGCVKTWEGGTAQNGGNVVAAANDSIMDAAIDLLNANS